jgi:hypothetical protein
MTKQLLILLTILLTLISCEKLLIEDPDNSPEAVFENLWLNFDRQYPAFMLHNVNWDSVYQVNHAKINNNISNAELVNVLAGMLATLKDPHAWLSDGNQTFAYEKSNFIHYYNSNNISKYLTGLKKNYMYTYGKLTSEIGYVHVSTFANQDGYGFIDNIINDFVGCKGIVIDVRNNAGGNSENAKLIVSRFCDKRRDYRYSKYRNGKGHNDLTVPEYSYLEPTDNAKPQYKIVLLTDQSVGSSGEDFTLMLRVLPQVTVIGDVTMGAPGGTPNPRELPNGWLYYLPTSLDFTIEGELVYNGIKPDIFVTQTSVSKDLMIEKAIELLK